MVPNGDEGRLRLALTEFGVSSLNNIAVGGVLLNPLNVVRSRWQAMPDVNPGKDPWQKVLL